MAYAILSSLPPIYGLYASTIAGYVLGHLKAITFPLPPLLIRLHSPSRFKYLHISAHFHAYLLPCPNFPLPLSSSLSSYVYSLFGTSGQLTIGPVALVSLFMSETYTKLGIPLTIKSVVRGRKREGRTEGVRERREIK